MKTIRCSTFGGPACIALSRYPSTLSVLSSSVPKKRIEKEMELKKELTRHEDHPLLDVWRARLHRSQPMLFEPSHLSNTRVQGAMKEERKQTVLETNL